MLLIRRWWLWKVLAEQNVSKPIAFGFSFLLPSTLSWKSTSEMYGYVIPPPLVYTSLLRSTVVQSDVRWCVWRFLFLKCVRWVLELTAKRNLLFSANGSDGFRSCSRCTRVSARSLLVGICNNSFEFFQTWIVARGQVSSFCGTFAVRKPFRAQILNSPNPNPNPIPPILII